jgi:hypothetical protein
MFEQPDHRSRAIPLLPNESSLLASDQLTSGVRKSDSARTVKENPKDFLKMTGDLTSTSPIDSP